MNADGSDRTQLTFNTEEERAPAWSPDGTRILFSCRPDRLLPTAPRPFEICVMNADGSDRTQLTHDGVFHGTPTWSPDGEQIVFHRNVSGLPELWTMEPVVDADQTQLTNTDGLNGYANWGVVKTTGQGEDQVAADSQDRAADHGKQHKDKHKGKKDNKHEQRHGGGKRHR
jgi:Tol biopolymer transport system component